VNKIFTAAQRSENVADPRASLENQHLSSLTSDSDDVGLRCEVQLLRLSADYREEPREVKIKQNVGSDKLSAQILPAGSDSTQQETT
jgi:hypothetical protein